MIVSPQHLSVTQSSMDAAIIDDLDRQKDRRRAGPRRV
jgi:hypothetical protein